MQPQKPKIIVKNSFCYLEHFPKKAIFAIRKILTYENENAKFELSLVYRQIEMAKERGHNKWLGMLYGKLKKLKAEAVVCWYQDGRFPTGHLSIVEKFLQKHNFAYETEQARKKPEEYHQYPWRVPPPELRYYQKEMIETAKQKERGVLSAATGTGKTLVVINLIKEFQATALLILPSASLLEQFKRQLELHFGKALVMHVTTPALKKGKKLTPIRVTTIQTINSLRKKGLLEAALKDVGFVYTDESHHAGSQSYTQMLPFLDHVYYRFGGSATHTRNDSRHLDLLGFADEIIYRYPVAKAIQDGFLAPIEFKMFSVDGQFSDDYQKEYRKNYCDNEELHKKVHEILRKIPTNEQVLIMVDRKEKAGETLHKYLLSKGLHNAYISGDDKKEAIIDCIEKFNDKEVRILIGTMVVGEGIDIRSTEHLFMLQGGKSEIKIMQAIGRCTRLSPGKNRAFVYDFAFVDTKYLKKHARKRIMTYKGHFPNSPIILEKRDGTQQYIGQRSN